MSEKRNKEKITLFLNLLQGSGQSRSQAHVKRKPDPFTVVQRSLNQEILQLERRLKDQMEVLGASEKALGNNRPFGIDSSSDSSMPKPTKELIKDIAVLELEVVYLEQCLLSLYRRAFDQQISTISPTTHKEKSKPPPNSLQRKLFHEDSNIDISSDRIKWSQTPKLPKPVVEQVDDAFGVHRYQSTLSHRAAYSARVSPSEDSLARALQTCHSQPSNFIEDGHCSTSGEISLAEYLGIFIITFLRHPIEFLKMWLGAWVPYIASLQTLHLFNIASHLLQLLFSHPNEA